MNEARIVRLARGSVRRADTAVYGGRRRAAALGPRPAAKKTETPSIAGARRVPR